MKALLKDLPEFKETIEANQMFIELTIAGAIKNSGICISYNDAKIAACTVLPIITKFVNENYELKK